MYQITEEGIRELELYIQDIPFKYATNILKLLNKNLSQIPKSETGEKPKK
ncbi:MAG TPA: hypothetical protein VLA48_03040 [Nitrososphaeraceae archaeon]|nr:hypothetical protein [Nitrososphaeraceae archaeon]